MEVRDRVKGLLRELIAIRSVSGEERKIQEFIEGRLRGVGVPVVRQEVTDGRFNLVCPSDTPFVVSCHVDTVPPIDMENAFEAKEVGGRIYGRGASDVKGALSALLTAVELFKERYPEEELPLSLAFVVDEETNSALGSEKVVKVLGNDKLCLVIEPTYGALCVAQNGAVEFSLVVEGESVHGAEFEKTENPIKVCIKLLESIEDKLSRPVNILTLKGGEEHYLVPKRCYALAEVKLWQGERWEEVEELIRESIKEVRTSCNVRYTLEDAEDFIEFRCDGLLDPLKEAYRRAVGKEPRLDTIPSWTDAANFHRAGYECVVFGFGSLKDSHTERESIGEDELDKMTFFFLELFEVLRCA